MADPLSTTSALVGLVAFSFQASKALRDTITSYKQHPKYVRDLRDELKALEDVLLLLQESLNASGEADYALLESPVQRCGEACKEFGEALKKCSGRNKADGTSFRDWLKIRWIGNDIHGFKDTLAGYKSTIAIAMAGVNLRTNKASLDVIREYKEMIQSTTIDLKDHLADIDNKLRENAQELHPLEDPVDRKTILTERECTIRSLEICVQVSEFIETQQKRVAANVTGSKGAEIQANAGAEALSPWQIMDESLRGCKFNIKSANAQLSDRLRYLSTSLSSTTSDALHTSTTPLEDRDKLATEIESVRQCLDICMQAEVAADKARVNVLEDIATAEDSRQILVSTIGDLIAAHRVTAGARSLQAIGQMSDETLQQLSRSQGNFAVDPARTTAQSHTGRDSNASPGRTLGSSNVRTL